MPATRSKNVSLKEQAQLSAVSAALASGTATSKRKSFADDEDLTVPSPASTNARERQEEDDDDDDDDEEAPVEEVSNKSTKRKLADDASKKKAQQKAAEEKRKKTEQERLQKRQQEAEAAALAALDKQQKQRKGKKAAAQAELYNAADEQPSGASEAADDEQDATPAQDDLDSETFDVEEDDLDADLDAPTEDDDAPEGETTTATAGPSRLDPSLFAQVFAKKAPAAKSILKRRAADPITAEMEAEERLRRKKLKAKRQGGIVKGRDGMPMRRLQDGTIVRSLSSHSATTLGKKKTNFDDDDAATNEAEEKGPLDPVLRPTPLDPSVSLPNAKIRGFKKRKLGHSQPTDAAAKAQATTATATKKQSKNPPRTEDDPLGLNDPAFLPGGEYYTKPKKLTGARPRKGSQNVGAGKPGALARQGFRGGGRRTNALTALSSGQRGGPALGFARSFA